MKPCKERGELESEARTSPLSCRVPPLSYVAYEIDSKSRFLQSKSAYNRHISTLISRQEILRVPRVPLFLPVKSGTLGILAHPL